MTNQATSSLADSFKQRGEALKTVARKAFEEMVLPLLKYPGDLKLEIYEENGDILIEPQTNFADMGKVIGKDKMMHKQLDTILRLVGEKQRASFKLLDLLPAATGHKEESSEPVKRNNWKPDADKARMERILEMFLFQPVKVEVKSKGNEARFKITFASDETISIAPASVTFALSRIFHAAGRRNGVAIFVEEKVKKCATV